ncbi:MAG TPA: isocitrate lyase/phosphoenolpyruvate mutase family protein, partial [Lapillicoccus sp.]
MNDRATDFLALHVPGTPLLMPNPWDAGSARMLAAMGFRALATTSAGLAGTHGRTDGNMTRDEALTHAATLVSAVDVPVSADLENGFGDDPAEVAETIRLAVESGLAGCSVEDWDPSRHELYATTEAAERVAAAAEAAHGGNRRIVLTARADGHVHGRRDPEDLDDTIRRLQAYEQAGAEVLYAPGVNSLDGIRRIVGAVSRPVNVLAMPDAPPVRRLAELGVARVSTGSGFYWAAMGGLAAAAEELRDSGTYAFWADARAGRAA